MSSYAAAAAHRQSGSLWQRLSQLIDFSDPVANQLKDLAQARNFSWNESRQNLVLEALSKAHYSKSASHLQKVCQRLQPNQLHQLLQKAAQKIPETAPGNDPALYFKRLSTLLTLEQIEAAVRSEHSIDSALSAAKEMVTLAKFYNNITHPTVVKPLFNRMIANVLWALESAIETILHVFGIYTLVRDMDNERVAHFRLESFLAIFSFLSTLVTLSIAVSGNILIGSAIAGTGILIGTALLAIYQKWLRPAPRTIKGFQNLMTEALSGNLPNIEGRQQYLDEIAAALIAGSQGPKAHPLLTGPSGVGKTEIFKAFARAVADGVYPELNGKQIFYINTADLLQPGKSFEIPVSLDLIKDRLRDRTNEVILIFDEIHQATKNPRQGNLGERLKTLLDGEFPYVIAATTDEEFTNYVMKNDALTRRFKQIKVESTNRDQTIAILFKILSSHPDLEIAPEAVEAVFDLFQEKFQALNDSLPPKNRIKPRPQPYMACRILAQAIAKAKDCSLAELKDLIAKKEAELDKNLAERVRANGSLLVPGLPIHRSKGIENGRISREIAELKTQLQFEQKQINTLQHLINKLLESKRLMFQQSLEIEKQCLSSPKKVPPLLKEFMETTYYLHQSWADAVANQRTQMGIQGKKIDKPFIEAVIAEELDQMKKNSELSEKAPPHPLSGSLHSLSGSATRQQSDLRVPESPTDSFNFGNPFDAPLSALDPI